jgi:Restriction endonuclease
MELVFVRPARRAISETVFMLTSSALARAADELQQREYSRLAAAQVPSVEGLRFLGGRQLRARVALMLEHLGYELLTPDTASDVVATKDGKKYLMAFAPPTELAPTHTNHLTRLHRAVIDANAASGFFITPRGFTRDAEAYAATAPLKLVDGPQLVASLKRSMAGVTQPDSYKAMCRTCGEIVTHRLDHAEAVSCANGHAVAPTIAQAALADRQDGGSSSRTYTPPRPYTRREVNAHNTKYIARMKKRRRPVPSEPDTAPEPAPEPFE